MVDPIIVLKFGSSVLASPADLPKAILEIAREVRRGRRVVAVVSAFAGVTDSLLSEVHDRHDDPSAHGLARYLETGESASAASLGLQLDEAGLPSAVVDAAGIGLTASGDPLDATPTHCSRRRFEDLFARVPVVVVPGFSGRDRKHRPVLLGRGGSDFTALFLARRLRAVECRLLKDIDGLLKVGADGTLDHGTRYAEAHYRDCLRDGGPLVQPRAVEYARRHGLDFTIARCGSPRGTRAGAVTTRFEPMPASRPLRVALAGLGTVGLGVYRWLTGLDQDVTVTGVLVKDTRKKRPEDLPPGLLTTNPASLLDGDPDLLIETLGDQATASDLIRSARAAGIGVVTADKVLVASSRDVLDAALDNRKVACSAAVGGAVPMLEITRARAEEEPITSVRGILNGTCNAVLDLIGAGLDPVDAIAEARRRGLAEADPAADLDGHDTAAKLSILAAVAFDARVAPSDISREVIRDDIGDRVHSAAGRGRELRQVAHAERKDGRIAVSVRLVELEQDDPLSGCRGAENRLALVQSSGRTTLVSGRGAGRWPTTLAVVGDVLDAVRAACSRPSIERDDAMEAI